MFRKKTSDAEVIERARRSLKQLERWGWWNAAFHYGVAICMGLALAWFAQFAIGKMIAGAQNRLELVFGFIVGIFFGTGMHQVFHNLVTARLAHVPDGRDRLLVQYHDALIECVRGRSDEYEASDMEPPDSLERFEAGASHDPLVKR